MGEIRDTLTRGSVKMATLEEQGTLPESLVGKEYSELTAAEIYQIDRNYAEVVADKIERGEMVKDMKLLVELFTEKGEEKRLDAETMASAIHIVEEFLTPVEVDLE